MKPKVVALIPARSGSKRGRAIVSRRDCFVVCFLSSAGLGLAFVEVVEAFEAFFVVVAVVLHAIEETGFGRWFLAEEFEGDGGVAIYLRFGVKVSGMSDDGFTDGHLEGVDAAEGPVLLRDAEDGEFFAWGSRFVDADEFGVEAGEVFDAFVAVDGVVV